MARRSSAFTDDLAELDKLQTLPLPAAPAVTDTADVQPQPAAAIPPCC